MRSSRQNKDSRAQDKCIGSLHRSNGNTKIISFPNESQTGFYPRHKPSLISRGYSQTYMDERVTDRVLSRPFPFFRSSAGACSDDKSAVFQQNSQPFNVIETNEINPRPGFDFDGPPNRRRMDESERRQDVPRSYAESFWSRQDAHRMIPRSAPNKFGTPGQFFNYSPADLMKDQDMSRMIQDRDMPPMLQDRDMNYDFYSSSLWSPQRRSIDYRFNSGWGIGVGEGGFETMPPQEKKNVGLFNKVRKALMKKLGKKEESKRYATRPSFQRMGAGELFPAQAPHRLPAPDMLTRQKNLMFPRYAGNGDVQRSPSAELTSSMTAVFKEAPVMPKDSMQLSREKNRHPPAPEETPDESSSLGNRHVTFGRRNSFGQPRLKAVDEETEKKGSACTEVPESKPSPISLKSEAEVKEGKTEMYESMFGGAQERPPQSEEFRPRPTHQTTADTYMNNSQYPKECKTIGSRMSKINVRTTAMNPEEVGSGSGSSDEDTVLRITVFPVRAVDKSYPDSFVIFLESVNDVFVKVAFPKGYKSPSTLPNTIFRMVPDQTEEIFFSLEQPDMAPMIQSFGSIFIFTALEEGGKPGCWIIQNIQLDDVVAQSFPQMPWETDSPKRSDRPGRIPSLISIEKHSPMPGDQSEGNLCIISKADQTIFVRVQNLMSGKAVLIRPQSFLLRPKQRKVVGITPLVQNINPLMKDSCKTSIQVQAAPIPPNARGLSVAKVFAEMKKEDKRGTINWESHIIPLYKLL